MSDLILLQQENLNLAKQVDNLNKEIERKGNIIVKLLEVIAKIKDEELRNEILGDENLRNLIFEAFVLK